MFFLFPVLGSIVTGAVAAIAGASLTSIITWSVIGGILVAAIGEMITRPKIREVANEKSIKGVFKIMVNRHDNEISLKDLKSESIRLKVKGDSIDSEIHDGDLISILD